MDKLQSAQGRSSTITPLARDADGRSIRLPEGVVGWRIRRHTGGRPKVVLGERKQPMVFPLEYTLADVEEILPPGTYRFDAVDDEGNVAATVPITIAGLRNGDGRSTENDDDGGTGAASALLPATASDVRLVLEANVRAMQMAFTHNERTLASGLHMAETLREGVQVLAEAQSEWIRSFATARGLFRNAPMQLPASSPSSDDNAADDSDAQEEDDGQDVTAPDSWATLLPKLLPLAQQLLMGLMNKSGADPGAKFEFADLLDWRRAYEKSNGKGGKAARALARDEQASKIVGRLPAPASSDDAAAEGGSRSTESRTANGIKAASGGIDSSENGPVALPARTLKPVNIEELVAALPAELLPKFMAVRARLTPHEQSLMLMLLSAMAPADRTAIIELGALAEDEIVRVVRAELAKLEPTLGKE